MTYAPCISLVCKADAYEECPLKMELNWNTALLKPGLRKRQPDTLFYCLQLLPRCLHCEITGIAKKSGTSKLIRELTTITPSQTLLKARTTNSICRAKKCQRPVWQNVGVYCEMHYNVIPYICGFLNKESPMSVRLIEKLDWQQALSRMSSGLFKSNNFEFTDILSAILNPDPDGPRVYAVDAEIFMSTKGGTEIVIEITFVEVKIGQIVVDAVFNNGQRALEASTKLAAYKLAQKSSATQPVRQVHTISEKYEQLKSCQMRPKDKVVEWSLPRDCDFDLSNTHLVLEQNGLKSQGLLPKSSCAILRPVEAFFGSVLKLKSFSLPLVFRVLFPEDSLVDLNHSATLDAVQMVQIVKLVAELITAGNTNYQKAYCGGSRI